MTSQAFRLEREIWIAAQPQTIFPFFTDPAKLTRWKGIQATLDPQPGGVYRANISGKASCADSTWKPRPAPGCLYLGLGRRKRGGLRGPVPGDVYGNADVRDFKIPAGSWTEW